mmetsp:Transcript_27861/g.66184  ORF Transcript_27861/g.66184 Transcript_27861/m.66184 type:complete len:460 (+) Transcript_27861:699-2078(+)
MHGPDGDQGPRRRRRRPGRFPGLGPPPAPCCRRAVRRAAPRGDIRLAQVGRRAQERAIRNHRAGFQQAARPPAGDPLPPRQAPRTPPPRPRTGRRDFRRALPDGRGYDPARRQGAARPVFLVGRPTEQGRGARRLPEAARVLLGAGRGRDRRVLRQLGAGWHDPPRAHGRQVGLRQGTRLLEGALAGVRREELARDDQGPRHDLLHGRQALGVDEQAGNGLRRLRGLARQRELDEGEVRRQRSAGALPGPPGHEGRRRGPIEGVETRELKSSLLGGRRLRRRRVRRRRRCPVICAGGRLRLLALTSEAAAAGVTDGRSDGRSHESVMSHLIGGSGGRRARCRIVFFSDTLIQNRTLASVSFDTHHVSDVRELHHPTKGGLLLHDQGRGKLRGASGDRDADRLRYQVLVRRRPLVRDRQRARRCSSDPSRSSGSTTSCTRRRTSTMRATGCRLRPSLSRS